MSDFLTPQELSDIFEDITYFASISGAILDKYFKEPGLTTKDLEVQFKDSDKSDPVTIADTKAQEILTKAILTKYPHHDVIGEEDKHATDISNIVWVIDPLDGTRNFLNGFPIYSSSIGLLCNGIPVAGALYIPWPNSKRHIILSAVKGLGVRINNEKYQHDIKTALNSSGIITLPGSFSKKFKFTKQFKEKSGELRMGGSIAYELSLLALGVSEYAVIGNSHIWDVAGSIPILLEAGYSIKSLSTANKGWVTFDSFNHLSNNPKYEDYLTRINPILVSPMDSMEYISANIELNKSSFLSFIKSIIR